VSESEFPIVVHGTTIDIQHGAGLGWIVEITDGTGGVGIDGNVPVEKAVARDAAALLRRTVERATAGLQSRLDTALAFADPTAQKTLLAALTPEAIEAYLSAHGWTDMSSRLLVNTREWRRDGTETYAAIPLRVGFCDYAFCVSSALCVIAASEGRHTVAVYLDMVAE